MANKSGRTYLEALPYDLVAPPYMTRTQGLCLQMANGIHAYVDLQLSYRPDDGSFAKAGLRSNLYRDTKGRLNMVGSLVMLLTGEITSSGESLDPGQLVATLESIDISTVLGDANEPSESQQRRTQELAQISGQCLDANQQM